MTRIQRTSLIKSDGRLRICTCLCVLSAILPGFAGDIPYSSRNVVNSSSFSRPESLALSDLDGDGDLDFAVAASVQGAIAWWEKGTGSDSNWIFHAIDNALPSANTIAAGDIDRDGYTDILASAGGITDDVAWWKNTDGTGTNWIRINIDTTFNGARSVSMTDVNGDGHHDVLACANSDGDIAWWQNIGGTGTSWIKRTVATGFSGVSSVLSADINRDGKTDVVGAASTGNEIAWWRNINGSGTNWVKQIIDQSFTGAQAIAVTDLDRDGDYDVVAAANLNPGGRVYWWENSDGVGSSWVARVISPSFNGAYAVSTADFDADGDIDVLAAAQVSDDVTWFENNNGIGTSWTVHTVDGLVDGARAVQSGDIDHDGDIDIAAVAFIQNQMAWWKNNSIHHSAAFCDNTVVSPTFQGAQSVRAVDLDLDGDPDIIGAASIDNRISWWENTDGDGNVWLERPVDTNVPSAWAITDADIDGDGTPDIVAASRSSHTIAWWKDLDGSGINWVRHTIDMSVTFAQAVAASDLDGDGDPDVVGASFGSGEVICWNNLGPGGTNWSKHIITSSFAGANAVVIADINHDGNKDILGSAFSAGRIAWWENVGGSTTNWIEHSVDDSFSGSQTASAMDMDHDGDLDVIGASFDLDQITWWENVDGTGTNWITHIVDQNIDGASAVTAVDLDADGDIDIAGGSSVVNRFAWWENIDGSTTNWIRRDLVIDTLDAADITTADLNRDGKPDILGAASSASAGQDPSILWWSNQGGQFALSGSNLLASTVTPASTAVVQSITFAHRGRIGDADIELTSLSLQFAKSNGVPLNNTEANNLFSDLFIYRDTGSGVFESGTDTLAASIDTFTLVTGVQSIVVADGDPIFQCPAVTSLTYFVVLKIDPNASNQNFRVSMPGDLVNAEDRTNDITMTRECSTGVVTGTSTINTIADISIIKSASPNPLVLDSNAVFTIAVTNRSPVTAYNLVMTDTLPDVMSFNAAGSEPGCSVTGNIVTCSLGNFTGNQVRVISIAVFVHGNAVGSATNTAEITTTSLDTNLANNISEALIQLPDTDMNGVADFADPDDDGDGMPDIWELQYGFDRTNSADAGENQDGDDFNNLQEYIADTNPTNDTSFFVVDYIEAGSSVQVQVWSSTGRVYTLQFAEDIIQNVWTNMPGQIDLPGNGSAFNLTDLSPGTNRSYRINVKLPPTP